MDGDGNWNRLNIIGRAVIEKDENTIFTTILEYSTLGVIALYLVQYDHTGTLIHLCLFPWSLSLYRSLSLCRSLFLFLLLRHHVSEFHLHGQLLECLHHLSLLLMPALAFGTSSAWLYWCLAGAQQTTYPS
jgi:hypothetical protein